MAEAITHRAIDWLDISQTLTPYDDYAKHLRRKADHSIHHSSQPEKPFTETVEAELAAEIRRAARILKRPELKNGDAR